MFYWIILGAGVLFGVILLTRMMLRGSAALAWRIVGGLAWTAIAGVIVWLTFRVSPGFAVVMLALLFPLWRAWLNDRDRQRQPLPATGRQSRLQTVFLDLTLDHDTGAMHGAVRHGAFVGWQLDALDRGDLQDLRAACLREDPASAALLDAWLDRHGPPHWRQDFAAGAASHAAAGTMTRAEALAVLGLDSDPGAEAVREAYKRLMLRNHPDQGGSDYLASKINQAKDLLLSK